MQLQGTLTDQHSHTHISHPFTVPAGATRIDIDFKYSPKRDGRYANLLTLSLFDPQQERGTGHRGQPTQQITISASDATPGYLPGPLPAGQWNIMINANLILPSSTVHYDFRITFGFDKVNAIVPTWKPGVTNPRGSGWYRGDLHGHTVHSDGSWDVDGLLNFARQHHLDFITLTDHNTVSALEKMDSRSSDDLLTMCGFELTTFYGHALAWRIRKMLDWRVRPGERTMPTIMQEIVNAGGLFAIAHPMAPGDPECTGCRWDYRDMQPGAARVVEVWNEHWDSVSNNEQSVQLWHQWLNEGHHLYATVGTDIHGPPHPSLEFGFNNVYAEALSEAAIFSAIHQGHNYLSSGPQIEFSGVSESGQTAMMGDSLPGEPVEITVRWSQCREGDRLRFLVNGEVKDEFAAGSEGEKTWKMGDGQKYWCLVEVRDAQNNIRALTNPIFVGQDA